jgi:3-oxo-5-alpha-steroid 4-dehydrogenase 1
MFSSVVVQGAIVETVYTVLLVFVFGMSALTWWGTSRRATRYGRYMKDGQKNTVPAKVGWLAFESPQLIAFAVTFWLSTDGPTNVALGLFVIWQGHYTYRALIYPLLRRDSEKRFPIGGIIAGLCFNSINGFLNGYAISHATHLNAEWLSDPRFMLGAILFAAGWLTNVHSDMVLIRLRNQTFEGYSIPKGGWFRWVSCPNYGGEIAMWCGFAVMSWTLAGLAFAVFTIANLFPRALSHHKWYLRTFDDYPPERKAIIPMVL